MVDKKSTKGIDDLRKMMGGSISLNDLNKIEVIPTGLTGLDHNVFGTGGLPRGRFTELYAKEGVGKTSFTLFLAGIITQRGGRVAWFESEGTITGDYIKACGVDEKYFDIYQDFTTGESALYMIKQALAVDMYDLIVLDSMPKLVPARKREAKTEKSSMYDNYGPSKMFKDWFNTLDGFEIKGDDKKFIKSNRTYVIAGEKNENWHKIREKQAHVLFINHAMDDQRALNPGAVTTSGGGGAKFEATFRLWIKYKGLKKDSKGNLLYRKMAVVCQKNKLAMPFKYTTLHLYVDGRIEEENDDSVIIDIGIGKGLIRQSGAFYSFGEDKVKGKEKAIEYLEEHPDLKNEILS